MTDATVIYYSSNREDDRFEGAIVKQMVDAAKGLPIVSVTQKPMHLGENICVGDVGQSNVNIFRQMLIAAEAAKTRFIITAEADTVHPREYFEYTPIRDDTMYAALPLFILSARKGKRRVFGIKEKGSEGSMVTNRQLLIDNLKLMLKGQPEWYDSPGRDTIKLPWLFKLCPMAHFWLSKPVVSFRTGSQLHTKTPYAPGSEAREIPYWGTADSMIAKYLGTP